MLVGTKITESYVSKIHQFDDDWQGRVNQTMLAQAALDSKSDHESEAVREAN